MYDVGGTPTPYTVVRTTDSNGWTGYFYITGIRDAYGGTSIPWELVYNSQAEGNMYVTGDGTKTITVP